MTPAARRDRGALGTVRRDRLVPAALAHAERGWRVFPLRPDDKRPAFPNHSADRCAYSDDVRCRRAGRHVTWEERATTDPVRIRAAWTSAPYGIGIACGPSRLLVVDLDVPKPGDEPPSEWRLDGVRDGTDVLAVLAARAADGFPWGTHTVRTASGGTHLYFAAPDGVELRSTAGQLGWLIDTRGSGGYVVAPPSTANGQPYAHDTEPGTPAAPLPAWLLDALSPAPLPAQQSTPVSLSRPESRHGAYVATALRKQAQRVADATPGTRNRSLYLSAVALGQLVAGGALSADDVTAHLEPAAQAAGLAPREIAPTISSGLTTGAKRPRTLTTNGAAA